MPTYEITSPSGKKFEVTAPEGATQDQILAYGKKQLGAYQNQENLDAMSDKRRYSPTVGMSPAETIAAGLGEVPVTTGRGILNLTGQRSGEQVKEDRKLDEPLNSTPGGFAGNVAGNVGMALLPGGALKAGGLVLRAPEAAAAGAAMLAPKTVLGGGGMGFGMGLIQPAESIPERAANVGLGVAGGAAVPTLARSYALGKSALEPLYEKGQDTIISRVLKTAAGNDPSVGLRLKNAQELVPGSIPTMGQAGENSGLASLERAAVATNPEVNVAYSQRMKQQNDARVKQLEDMAGSSGERDFHDAAREQAAQDLYQKAYDKGVDLRRDATTGQFLTKAQQAARKGEITKLMSAPAMQDAMAQAKVLMQNELKKVSDPAGSVQGLDYVKRALDDKIKATTGNEQRVLVGLKNRLLTTIDTLSPDYAQARITFRDMSKPINQMDVAQTLADKSIKPLDDTLQAASYARNLNDQTAATATGYKAATLENTLTTEQLNKLNAIKQDLQRADAAKNSGRGPGSDTVQKLAYTNIMEQSGVPTWLRTLMPSQVVGNLTSRAADLVYSNANKALSTKLANTTLDPKEASRLWEMLGPQERNKLLQLSGQAMGSIGLAVPGLVNAQK